MVTGLPYARDDGESNLVLAEPNLFVLQFVLFYYQYLLRFIAWKFIVYCNGTKD